ncbi:MAG: hypothetical protein AAFY26_06785 [Cyanobacteria bacterium J06638_22]
MSDRQSSFTHLNAIRMGLQGMVFQATHRNNIATDQRVLLKISSRALSFIQILYKRVEQYQMISDSYRKLWL